MIDDDLDRLLSDVDGGKDFFESKEDAIRVKQRIARKSDINIEGSGEKLLTEEGFIEKIKSLAVDRDIFDYSKGVAQAVSSHALRTTHFRKLLSEFDVPDSVHQIIQKNKYTFIRFLENIEKLYGEYATFFSIDSLVRKARKDYPIYFEGFEDGNKVDFLILKELFLRLREFNSRTRKEWSELSKSIGVINLTADGKSLYSELNAQLEASLVFCETTDKFLRRISKFLAIPAEDFDVSERDIANKTIYYQSMPYKYDALFDLVAYIPEGSNTEIINHRREEVSADDKTSAIDASSQGRHLQDNISAAVSDEQTSEYTPSNIDTVEASIGPFTIKGRHAWNTREPYVLRLQREKLSKDYEDLASSFYYLSEPENAAQEGAVKRAMIRFMSDTSNNIGTEYEEFIYKTLITQVQDLCDYFGFKDDSRNLFIYHLGPVTLHRIMISFLQVERIGLCLKYLPGNKVVRYIPAEYIKEKILNWNESNINTLSIDFDKVQYFDEIRRTVLMKYNTELAINIRQLEDMILKLKLNENPQFNKQEFFKSKWNQWFGAARIPVYNRFIEKSIFKQPA